MKIRYLGIFILGFLLFSCGTPPAGWEGGSGGNGNGDGNGNGNGNGNGDGDQYNCQALCELESVCDPDSPGLEECLVACESWASDLQGECLTANINLNECLAGLDCQGLADYWEETTGDYPCAAQDAAVSESCY